MLDFPVVQIAYFVTDAKAAAERAAGTFGAGPFFLVENIELAWCEHRGVASDFRHTSAYGQWGGLMMELVEQVGEGPSPFRDMYGPGEEGIHHMAMMVDSLANAYNRVDALGLEVAMRAGTRTGTEFAFVDTVAQRGHMLELYEKSETLQGFYAMVQQAAENWDGSHPLRPL